LAKRKKSHGGGSGENGGCSEAFSFLKYYFSSSDVSDAAVCDAAIIMKYMNRLKS
jgi:hypothetical protein